MKKKKQQIKFVSVQSLLWFVVLFFHSKAAKKKNFFFLLCVWLPCSRGFGRKRVVVHYTVLRKKRYKNKGVTDTRIITSIVTRRRRKTRKKTKRGRKKT